MTAAVHVPWFPGSRDAARRFVGALALSVAAHWLLIESLALETTLQTAQPAMPMTLTVRIEPPAEAEHEGLPVPVPTPLPAAPRDRVRIVEHTQASARAKQGAEHGTEATLVLPQAPDPTYYSARDLDLYPRPATPLALDFLGRNGSHAATIFRFQVLIDESGTVNEVSAVEGEPAPLWEELRALLAATRFVPGRKDGHAVKSRVTLSIDFDAMRRYPDGR